MYIKGASLKRRIVDALLFSFPAQMFLSLCIAQAAAAQSKLNLSEPLKKCMVYGGGNGLTRIVASDNEQNLLLTTDNLSFVSLNADSNTESWKSLSGGKLESEITDGENLFFVASFETESQRKSYTLNSVSRKTGITNWQLRLNEHSRVKLNPVDDHGLLFLTIDNRSITAVRKEDGKIFWTKEFSDNVVTIAKSEINPQELYIISENGLKRVSIKDGELIEELKFKKGEIGTALVGKDYVLSGYPTGEIAKTSITDGQNDVLWKIKAGAGISGLAAHQDEVLVTSLDNFIYLYSVASGKLRWKKRVAGRINVKPQIYGDLAIVVNSGDNSMSVLELGDGKIINQLQLEQETYFTGQPVISGRYVILQTSRGIYFYTNAGAVCK